MSNNVTVTIKEASELLKLDISTIYKAIKTGRLEVEIISIGNKKIKKVKKKDLIRVFSDWNSNKSQNKIQWNSNGNQLETDWTSNGRPLDIETKPYSNDKRIDWKSIGNQKEVHSTSIGNQLDVELISNIVQKSIDNYFDTKQTQLMKPLEEQSMFLAGKLTNENQFLKQRLETVLEENKQLNEQLKALPGPAESIQQIITENTQNLNLLQKEKEELEQKLKQEIEEKSRAKTEAEEALKQLKELPAPAESIQKILLDNANNLKELATEKAKIEIQLKDQNSTIKEKERALKELQEIHQKEIEQLKLQSEEEKKLIAEAWRKEMEQNKKPWWKLW